ncbi:hypothetical protein D3C72_2264180 [compost metagenome]
MAAGRQGGADRVQGALDQQGRPGETELADGARIEGAGEGRLHIVGVVNPHQLFMADGAGLLQRIP